MANGFSGGSSNVGPATPLYIGAPLAGAFGLTTVAASNGDPDVPELDDATGWELTSKDGRKFFFNANGRLESMRDPQGNTLSIVRDAADRINLLEYAFNGAPKTPDTSGSPVPVALIHPGTGFTHLGLIYTRPKGRLDLRHTVQMTENFSVWRNAVAETDTISITDNGNGTETVVVRDKLPFTASAARFLRMKIDRIPSL